MSLNYTAIRERCTLLTLDKCVCGYALPNASLREHQILTGVYRWVFVFKVGEMCGIWRSPGRDEKYVRNFNQKT
jgi:hypothetical protein